MRGSETIIFMAYLLRLSRKTTEPKTPCPLLVPLGISDMPDTNDTTSRSAEIAEAEHSNALDAIQDIMGSQVPTIMVRLSTEQLRTHEAALAALLKSQIKYCL